MTTHLQELLRSLCWKTEWDYAVFWKLKHHDRMELTWEDGYYNNQNKLDGHFPHDTLGLVVSKLSNHVYSLGEGIIGQVAITGKNQWIFAGEHAMNSYSSLELYNNWQAQFAAGIKTILVASVVPHGVIQFGSLNKINENLQFLAQIKDAFNILQELACQIQTPVTFSLQNMLQMDIPSIISSPDVLQDYLLHQTVNMENISNFQSSMPGVHSSQSCITENSKLYDGKITGEKYGVEFKHSLPFEEKINEMVASDILPEFNCVENAGNLKPSFIFSAGTELHEALGPDFLKQCYSFLREDNFPSPIPEIVESSMITSDSGNNNLLEDVVANCALKKSKSFCTSESMLTTERMPQPSINTSHTIGSSYYSMGGSSLVEESMRNCLKSSDSYSIRSVEQGKPNKKRARSGENSRPRPRDRQLIQDRIKEIRELVPNGSKCSIDSLLERTIKHMRFMQNVSEHSEKLTDCAKSKSGGEMETVGSSYKQGSSWAVEVGGHMKICPILVKNLSMNGQMLIEMLCDDCDHFLEITETIRSLGLTILKGITESHADKTWMRFVVEGESNRKLHRMDVLWSLVQILQSKTTF